MAPTLFCSLGTDSGEIRRSLVGGCEGERTGERLVGESIETFVAKELDGLGFDLVELKREHAHVHLGFADNQVQGWLRSAGLNPLEPIHFPGRRLMTGIWRGEREVPQRTAAPSVSVQGAPR